MKDGEDLSKEISEEHEAPARALLEIGRAAYNEGTRGLFGERREGLRDTGHNPGLTRNEEGVEASYDRRNSGSGDGNNISKGTGLLCVTLTSSEDTESVNSETKGTTLHDEYLFETPQEEGEWECTSDASSGSLGRFSFLRPASMPYEITVNAVDSGDYLSVRDQVAIILDRLQVELELSDAAFESQSYVTPSKVLKVFLTKKILDQISEMSNRYLVRKGLKKTDSQELECLLRVLFTASVYGISITRLYENTAGALFYYF